MDEVNFLQIIKYLLLIEILLSILGGILVTNMDPLWMQQSVYALFLITLATGIVYILISRRIERY